ncbi:hypothetical protein [Pseudobacteriovorax antillogorgiicola]|uniref:Uncharacterized protein n=1 Tax=Pseudobacteriovorax antillogorgiicola TaxID=1513793 RepID=A0A1Y6BS21_9BACT|nr:hypothetical protein [Pseudobacteriovorax antillogorgiicola]TCS53155.1 hypothetical protein EDD56_108206 [Pseudobacteriovorax antillogorgiicola]SMF25126.1 hypothetical protein SAMN06296036_10840 [Pseudobacteriovorax antillogorgiicola]
MTMAAQTLVEKYLEFTKDSLNWCAKESEESTSKVSNAIDSLLKDTARVSELSTESLTAIEGLHAKLKVHFESGASVEDLIKTLQELANDHDEIKNVIHPIIESLQFQDRLRQNLENIEKMIPCWLKHRQAVPEGASAEQLRAFGENLLNCTTMKEERDYVRGHIDGLKEEEEKESVMLF